ncbi:hypothetical protein [Halobellus rufus]|uniref:hypothetical protein n=1 Tax=Halobellus rufus TaxID=1448860 RepID=UPI0006789B62|nr:hypothetical protein [Halobellus rufus]
MTTLDGRITRFKRPEYTGENRCLPCTAVNLVITSVLAALAAAAWLPLGLLAAGIGLTAIYFRGYLVPGTPTLTKRYLPQRVHRLFGTHGGGAVDLDDGFDAESIENALQSLGALEACAGGNASEGDLCLATRFRESWYARFDAERADAETARRLFSDLDVDPEAIDVDGRANAFAVVAEMPTSTRATTLAKWGSAAAFVADAAADTVLRKRSPGWADLDVDARLELLGALRLWLDRCPSCRGTVSLDEETVESCCRSVDVVAATCEDCEARLFEAQFSPDAAREA